METNTQIVVKKTPVMIRREMVNNPAVLNALEPVERAVFLASTDTTISEYTGPQLAAELKNVLFFIAKDVGYRITDEQDRQYMIIRTAELLKRYYSNLTLKDFRMAFEMSITGQLDEFLPKGRDGQPDRCHYQQFNAEYVCKILNAYTSKRAHVLKKAHEAMPKPEPERDLDAARTYSISIREELCNAYDSFRESGKMPNMSPISEMLYYQLLFNAGLAPEIIVTIEEQNAILQRTINQLALKGNIGEMNQLKQAGPDAPELQYGAYTLARRKALAATFRRMVEQGIQITDYISYESIGIV